MDQFMDLDMTPNGLLHSMLNLIVFFPLTLSEIPKPLRLLYVYIRTRTLRSKYGLLTDTLRYHHTVHTRCSRASGLQLAAILQHVYSELSAIFWRVLENYDCRTKFNSSLGMEYNGTLYGFFAVKVKLVDSLIWWPFIPGWIRPRTPMTRRFDTCASFILNNSFSKFPYFYWRFV